MSKSQITTEEFIKRAKKVHGKKYDYSKFVYKNNHTKSIIICPEHGEFLQIPTHHLHGSGCPACAGTKKLTTAEFIKKAEEVHGDKYDYSKVKYVKANEKVEIICKEHGSFWQKPNGHLGGYGCDTCGGSKELTTAEFIKKAEEVHGNKYDYSKVKYEKSNKDVEIICKEHGSFWQKPGGHLSGRGCPKCRGMNKTREEFITQAKEVHGNKYDYRKTKYVDSKTKVEIICTEHGSFWQNSSSHLSGAGCKLCSSGGQRTTEEFIKKAKEVHGNKYDYSKVKYEKSNKDVEIICKEHGSFWQTPSSHIGGSGCPRCLGRDKDTNIIIEEFIRVHGDRYDYSKVKYVKANEKVEIICKEHGSFWQTPSNHLNENNCPKCSKVFMNQEYFIEKAKKVHGDRYDYSKLKYKKTGDKVEIICKEHGGFWQTSNSHLNGNGCPVCNLGWTINGIRSLLKDMRSKLPFLSQVERRYILLAKGVLDISSSSKGYNVITDHLATDPNLDLIEIDKFINNDPNIYDDAMETGDLSLVKDKDNGIYDATTPKEKEPSLPIISNVSSIFAGTDCLKDIISDQTIIEALINESVGKAIQQICQNEKCIEKIRKEKKKLYSKEAQNRILDLYKQAKHVKIPKDYNFRINGKLIEPNLMQRFTVVLLRKNKNLLNYSGTGAGKTLSAILAAREINAKKTIIICPNDVISGWTETISGVDPTSSIFVNNFDPKLDLSHSNYLIFNIEKFQLYNAMDNIKLLLSSTVDFLIVDEVQMAKYRNSQKATARNINIRALASNARKNNENMHVLVMSATPVVNEISEGYSILEILTGEEFDSSENRISVENCVKLRSHIVSQGIRWVMNHKQKLNIKTIDVDATEKKDEVIKLNSRNPMELELIFIDKKLEAIKDEIKPGTIIYSLYKGSGLLEKCRRFVKNLGFSVSEYTGDQNINLRKQIKDDFVAGKIDVLLATSPISTGVDKLQYRCNNMIIVSLSWTSAQTEQLIGRILRQGQTQEDVNVVIPICYIDVKEKGKRWSWDQYRYNIIENKRTMSDIVVSGTIPDRHHLSDQKVLAAMLDWIKRVDDGKIIDIPRRKSFVPLSEKSMEKRRKQYGDFTELNRRWNSENSFTTHKRLQEDPSEYDTYHNEQQKAMNDWDVKPIDHIIIPFINQYPDKVIGDFGSGPLAELSTKVKNKVYSFDHVGDKNVISCDISSIPKEYHKSMDVAVFSLSLMGRNFIDYIKEAKKCLTKNGILYIIECSSRIKNLDEVLKCIQDLGFKDVSYETVDRFIRISAVEDGSINNKKIKIRLGRKY